MKRNCDKSKMWRGGRTENEFRLGKVAFELSTEISDKQLVCGSRAQERGSDLRVTSVNVIVVSLGMDWIIQRKCAE